MRRLSANFRSRNSVCTVRAELKSAFNASSNRFAPDTRSSCVIWPTFPILTSLSSTSWRAVPLGTSSVMVSSADADEPGASDVLRSALHGWGNSRRCRCQGRAMLCPQGIRQKHEAANTNINRRISASFLFPPSHIYTHGHFVLDRDGQQRKAGQS